MQIKMKMISNTFSGSNVSQKILAPFARTAINLIVLGRSNERAFTLHGQFLAVAKALVLAVFGLGHLHSFNLCRISVSRITDCWLAADILLNVISIIYFEFWR